MATTLLRDSLKVDLPDHAQAALECSDLTDQRITEYKADAVVSLRDPMDEAQLAVIVEVQRDRDPEKRWSWPYYLAAVRSRHRCATMLLVLCTEDPIARWAAQPIELGHPDLQLTPLTVGPHLIPQLSDATQVARDPELGMLSALAHASGADTAVLDAVCVGFADIDPAQAREYTGLMLALLPVAARTYMEALVATGTYEYMSEFTRQYVEQGRSEGRSEGCSEGRLTQARLAVVQVLDGRGFDVPDRLRQRIDACADLDQLGAWIRRAATVDTVEELFD